MRTTLTLDDKIIRKASRLTGVRETSSLVRLGLQALVALGSSRLLANLGGSEGALRAVPRRRSSVK